MIKFLIGVIVGACFGFFVYSLLRIGKKPHPVIFTPPEGCKITPNEYQVEALRTASGMNPKYPMFLNGVLGLGGESGECEDIVKKHLFQGHDLDLEHLAKELGDVSWYLAVTAYSIGYDLETVLQMNVDKLRQRYPNGFDPERSLHRKAGGGGNRG